MQVRFFFELPNEVAVVAGVNLPVDLAYFIPWSVLAMLREFATSAFGCRSMLSCEQSVDDGAREQFKISNLLHHMRIDKIRWIGDRAASGRAVKLRCELVKNR